MSYEPALLINKDQLDAKSQGIEMDAIKYPDDKAIQYVHKLSFNDSVKFMGINVITAKPEMSNFNKEVWDTLFTYDIEYAELI